MSLLFAVSKGKDKLHLPMAKCKAFTRNMLFEPSQWIGYTAIEKQRRVPQELSMCIEISISEEAFKLIFIDPQTSVA